MKLLLGTTNPAKIADYQKYLRHAKLELLTLRDIGFIDEPLEIGKTFAENALQKARFYAEATEYPTLADDGGFEVDALDGRPGVDSNRWLGPSANDEDKINKILELLKGIPESARTARIRSAIAVYFPDVKDYISVEEAVGGMVPLKASSKIIPRVPYRSLLFLPEFKKYSSELNEQEAARVSHRNKACKQLLLKLEPFLN